MDTSPEGGRNQPLIDYCRIIDMSKKSPSISTSVSAPDATGILQAAIEKIHIFTQPGTSRLEVKEDGSLIATEGSPLERIVGLAKYYIAPLFSDHIRLEKEKKFNQIKQEILQARDILKSHSSLIEKLKEGDPSQQKLAHSALEAIHRYNTVIAQDSVSLTDKYDLYNCERNQLLLDEEIKGQPIELPRTVSIKYDSDLNTDTTRKTFRALGASFLPGATQKICSKFSSTHKKGEQFMLDTFRMKAIRLIQSHLTQQNSMAEVLNLVKHATIEIEEKDDLIVMHQHLEIGPGSMIALVGSFKPPSVDSKFLSMPIIDSFRLTSEATHSGFPYPSQHTAWALTNTLTEARPLRAEQVPCFEKVNARKKHLSQQLLFDPHTIAKARQLYKRKRDIFNQYKEIYLPLHRQLQVTILEGLYIDSKEIDTLLDPFYHSLTSLNSPFDALASIQQRLVELFIQQPAQQLEEEWLEDNSSLLRTGTSQEKFYGALSSLQKNLDSASSISMESHYALDYIHTMGPLLGKATQGIPLQYLSEKIGFAPPMLNDSERKIQMCAFNQLITFLDELENPLNDQSDLIKNDLTNKYKQDIEILSCSTIEDFDNLSSRLTNELEIYFNSRFYTQRT